MKFQVDQLSLIVRWVSIYGEVKVKETFLGFVSMQSGKAQVVADTAIKLLSELGFNLEKLRGQVSSESLFTLLQAVTDIA